MCFIYHRFGDTQFPSTNVSVKDFGQHLRYLSENNFQVLTLSDALHYLESDSPPKKTAVITIDDGYKSFYENAMPLLRKYKMKATLFINTETVGGKDYMDWSQLKDVMMAGVEIGNHTHSHAYFLNEDESTRYQTFENEIKKSQEIISKNLNTTPALFAYPYGEFDKKMKEIVRKMGFKCGAAQFSGVLYHGTDLYHVPRFPMAEGYADLKMFAEKAKMKPLLVKHEPTTTVMNEDLKPTLSISFRPENLNVQQLQCFVQGADCISDVKTNNSEITVTVTSSKELTRRRTLYTITIPDSSGNWHWFSHLWINPTVK